MTTSSGIAAAAAALLLLLAVVAEDQCGCLAGLSVVSVAAVIRAAVSDVANRMDGDNGVVVAAVVAVAGIVPVVAGIVVVVVVDNAVADDDIAVAVVVDGLNGATIGSVPNTVAAAAIAVSAATPRTPSPPQPPTLTPPVMPAAADAACPWAWGSEAMMMELLLLYLLMHQLNQPHLHRIRILPFLRRREKQRRPSFRHFVLLRRLRHLHCCCCRNHDDDDGVLMMMLDTVSALALAAESVCPVSKVLVLLPSSSIGR